MPITILNNIFRAARDSSGNLFSSSGLKRCKSECFRNLQTQTELKSQDEENNAGLCGRSTSLWKSLAGREEGGRRFGLEQTEHVLDYYKKRWVSNNIEKGTTESALDLVIDADTLTAGKSLYSQWAARTPSQSGDRAKPQRPLKSLNDFVVSSNNDPFRHQTERIMSAFSRLTASSEGRERSLDRLRRPLSAPMFWVSSKSPLDILANNEQDTTVARARKNQKPSRASMKSARPSANDSEEEYFSDKGEDESADEEQETAVKKCLNYKRTRTRPTTTGSVPLSLSPDDIPLFDVNTMKKKYVFGGRLGASHANS